MVQIPSLGIFQAQMIEVSPLGDAGGSLLNWRTLGLGEKG